MTLFQILALLVIAGLLISSLSTLVRNAGTRRDQLLWSMLWLAAGIAIAWPRSTAIVARALGIGRGADLVLYCAVVVMMIGFLMVYVRLRRLRRQLTLIVRHLAIEEAHANPKEESIG